MPALAHRPPRLAHVVPLTPVEGVYTYRVPDELAAEAVVGARVLVSFGRRALTGVIVKREDGEAERKLKPLLDVLDARPSLTPELLGLTRWVADYTLCDVGREAIKAALPSGTEVETRRVVHGLATSWPEARGQTILDALAEVERDGNARPRGGRRARPQDRPERAAPPARRRRRGPRRGRGAGRRGARQDRATCA